MFNENKHVWITVVSSKVLDGRSLATLIATRTVKSSFFLVVVIGDTALEWSVAVEYGNLTYIATLD